MQTRVFPAEVFARLAPDVYFERHLQQGKRPTGRDLGEARPLDVRRDDALSLPGALGSAVVRAGNATVVCGITGGVTSFEGNGGVYANVEIHRGGHAGNPTAEEQVLTMTTHRLVQAAGIDPQNFVIGEGRELCLMAQIVVLSRTGPSMDLVWASLRAALQDCRVPVFAQDERTLEMVPTAESRPLVLPSQFATEHRTFGVTRGVVLADIDGAVEEECVPDRICIARNGSGNLASFSLVSPSGCCSADAIEHALALSRAKSA